ncbi:MAG: class I SAM-dependent methyltransferase [Desulfobulbaceae bacterium]
MLHNIKKIARKMIELSGYDIQRIRHAPSSRTEENAMHPIPSGLIGIQYACGPKLLKDWINVDFYPERIMKDRFGMTPEFVYYQADLRRRQPFPDNSVNYAFAEDFIEHLSQGDSIIFLSECLRVLRKGGVLRLSFPGLAGVLQRHFSTAGYSEFCKGLHDAYLHYEHVHFYSREELELVAGHLGFSRIRFVAFCSSEHEALRGLETRDSQHDLNIYVELTK